MECESHFVVLHNVTHLASLEVLTQQWAINGVSSLLDDLLGALHWILETQIGYALIGNNDVDTVHCVVDVSTHGHDGRNAVVLLDRWTHEDAGVSIAGEVTATANTVHQASSTHVRRVDVTEDVGLDSGVHREHAKATDNLRVVRDFARTHEHLVVKFVDVGEELVHSVVGKGE